MIRAVASQLSSEQVQTAGSMVTGQDSIFSSCFAQCDPAGGFCPRLNANCPLANLRSRSFHSVAESPFFGMMLQQINHILLQSSFTHKMNTSMYNTVNLSGNITFIIAHLIP